MSGARVILDGVNTPTPTQFPTSGTPAEPRSGTWDDALRFDDLTEDEQARVVEEASWTDAVRAAIWLLHGYRVGVAIFADADDHTAVAVFAPGGICHFGTFGAMAADWPNRRRLANGHRALDETSGVLIDGDVAARMDNIGYAIEAIFDQRDDVTTLLREGDFTAPINRPYLAPILTAWWTERLDAGLSPAAAWMMLGLLLQPDSFALLAPPTSLAPPAVATP